MWVPGNEPFTNIAYDSRLIRMHFVCQTGTYLRLQWINFNSEVHLSLIVSIHNINKQIRTVKQWKNYNRISIRDTRPHVFHSVKPI